MDLGEILSFLAFAFFCPFCVFPFLQEITIFIISFEALGRFRHISLKEIMKVPSRDERKYEVIRLANELEVLLVSDTTTDKAAAALDVHCGNLSDPINVDGLAHFCEHLLFMGTTSVLYRANAVSRRERV